MVKGDSIVVAVRLPKGVVEFIDREIESGMFMNRSDWIQQVLRQYVQNFRGGGESD